MGHSYLGPSTAEDVPGRYIRSERGGGIGGGGVRDGSAVHDIRYDMYLARGFAFIRKAKTETNIRHKKATFGGGAGGGVDKWVPERCRVPRPPLPHLRMPLFCVLVSNVCVCEFRNRTLVTKARASHILPNEIENRGSTHIYIYIYR